LLSTKIKFPYNNIPPSIRSALPQPVPKWTQTAIHFDNGSSITVGASLRSGTYNFLHISEYGKICARTPLKAKEVKTGALNTIAPRQLVFIESTAEGQEGDFFEKCQESENRKTEGLPDKAMDYRFHFFPWYMSGAYRTSEGRLTEKDDLYFHELEHKHGIQLDTEQKYWYVQKSREQGDDMKREHPSIPAEAFEASVEGAYYRKEMNKLREAGRFIDGLYDKNLPVETIWDLGISDAMSIWFRQVTQGEYRYIHYFENSGEGIEFYVNYLASRGYRYSRHIAPHDIEVRELGTGVSRKETAKRMGLKFDVAANIGVPEGIQAVRNHLPLCYFDPIECEYGIKCLDNYRKEWDDVKGMFRDKPLHNWASHGSDSFRYASIDKLVRTMSTKRIKGLY
jgi:hypothetical protein